MLTLRPYQRESIDHTYSHWYEGGGDGLIVIPTGGGKSLIIAQLLQELKTDYPLMRICVITHTKELIEQNYNELLNIWPSAPAGIYSAGIGRRDTHQSIIFCGIQSVYDKAYKFQKFDLILIDEAHLISRNSSSMYGVFFTVMRERYPDMRLLGLTATPYRLDSGRLDEGDDAMFEKIIYEANVADLIEQGYLSPLVSKRTGAEISTKGVHKRGGEYIANELEKAAMKDDLVARAAKEIVDRAGDRKAWLCFCTGIAHAKAVRDALRDFGISAEEIDGNTPKQERETLIRNFRGGAIRCLVSVNVLSIGFNVPQVDLIALLRPTTSPGLYIQQVGRGFRKAPGKTDCLILDFARNVATHGPVDIVIPPPLKEADDPSEEGKNEDKDNDDRKAKECPSCNAYVRRHLDECPYCGYLWELAKENNFPHLAAPEDVDILSTGKASVLTPSMRAIGWEEVTYVTPSVHSKTDKPPTLRLTYSLASGKRISKWLCFSHPRGSYPQKAAVTFWRVAGGAMPYPSSSKEAFERFYEMRKPTMLRHGIENGYDTVLSVEYKKKEVAA